MIRIENIGKVFNAHSRNRNQVLKGVSFEFPDKGLVAIFGKSGSGKTTLLNIIGGLDKQDSGKIYINGECTTGKVDHIRNAKIGFIFQNYYLERGYTIAEIMRNQMIIAGFKDEEEIKRRTEEVLKLVEMERYKNKQGDALSGGQKQRVAIARALIKGSDVILADEPTGNLDAENTTKVMDILKEISKTQLVVLVTHEVSLIEKYADSHIKLVDGRIAADAEITEAVEYLAESNEIKVDETAAKTVKQGDVDITFYGDDASGAIQIISDNGNLYVKAGKNVTVIDEASEKKLVFSGEKRAETKPEKVVPKFEKSNAKKNGKLFSFKRIFRLFKGDGEEKLYSTANAFKQIFILAMAIVIAFFSFTVFEILNLRIENKPLGDTSIYTDLNAYSELRKMSETKYKTIDFFDTQKSEGMFSYSGLASLSGIKADYTPRAINEGDTFEKLYGRMPEEGEVLISRALAETLKQQFRLEEINNDRSILLVTFNNEYRVRGIVEGDEPLVYMVKSDYVNFLGVYGSLQFSDVGELFFKGSYGSVSYSAVVRVSDKELANDKVTVEINRNSLYKMMVDSTQADYEVNKTNTQLKKTPYAIQVTNSKMYVEKFEITRRTMETDICVYVNRDVMNNILVYISPNLDALKLSGSADSEYFFDISVESEDKVTELRRELRDRGVTAADISAIYARENADMMEEATGNLTIFYIAVILLMLIYFFIEKSGSIKNSKEYGIFRAIGVNKSNLLFKECVTAIANNILSYCAFFLITTVLFAVRYAVMNVAFGGFLLLSVGFFAASAVVMVGISLVPYLFVLYKTPAQILARYDI